MNKAELIEAVTHATGQSKRVVADVVDAAIDTVQKEVKQGRRVTVPGFGTFERRNRSARTARNPRTGEEIQVKATQVPAFKPGSWFKQYVGGS